MLLALYVFPLLSLYILSPLQTHRFRILLLPFVPAPQTLGRTEALSHSRVRIGHWSASNHFN
ncbi:hypothetical protein AMTRI_Chr04g183150 [Amborella trichopoda]